MTDAQLDELRRWAATLAEDGRPDLRAAAKAILMLADEVERLQTQLAEAPEPVEKAESGNGLRGRLGRLARPR